MRHTHTTYEYIFLHNQRSVMFGVAAMATEGKRLLRVPYHFHLNLSFMSSTRYRQIELTIYVFSDVGHHTHWLKPFW